MEELYTRVLRVQVLLGGSNRPTSQSPEAVEWIICVCVTEGANPRTWGGGDLYRVRQTPLALSYKGFKVHKDGDITGNACI